MTRVAIIGYGALGKALGELFPQTETYDEPQKLGRREAVNGCEFAMVCVPTPMLPDGSCDTSIVEDVVGWLEADIIVIRSTVPPGTTERLIAKTNKRLVFQPEYGPGETPGHPFHDLRAVNWAILGGPKVWTRRVADFYKTVFGAELRIYQTDSTTAELVKYMENAFLALKVTFCNEFYSLATIFEVDYDEVRELWLQDPRIGRSHTVVREESRGFGGKCLPKDLSAIIEAATANGYRPRLLAAVREINDVLRHG